VLHLKHTEEFACIALKDSHKTTTSFVCQLPNNIFISDFKKREYNFLSLEISKKQGKTYLNIYPKTKKSFIYAIKTDIINDKILETKTSFNQFSKHWTLFFSNEETNLIFKKNETSNGLDFGLKLNMPRPFIGTLDEDKKPIVIKNQEGISTLLKIKELYEKKEYRSSILEISLFLQQKPDSIFKKEMLMYSLRNYYKVGTEELAQNIVDVALDWLNQYPSDKNIPEVLFYLGTAYSKLYKQTEAIQVFNELIRNYKTNKFSFMAKLELGDNLKSSANINKSIKLYEDVLYNTKDVNIALLAALRIAEKSLDDGVLKKARYHYKTIINKDIDFLIKDIDKAYALAIKLINSDFTDLGLKILDRILEKIDKKMDPLRHAEILFKTADLYKNTNVDKAIKYFQQYIKLYPKGLLVYEAKEELDKLVFKSNGKKDLTDSEILLNIEYILKKYPRQLIAKKAFYKKMKIFFKLKKYSAILANIKKIEELSKEVAPDKETFLNEIKMKYVISLLEAKQCNVFVQVIESYKLEVPRSMDNMAYECFYQQFIYKKAREIVDRQLISSADNNKILWTYRLIQILIKNLDYNNMILAIEDLLDMVKINHIDNIKYKETIYDLFFAYAYNKDEDIMIGLAKQIEKDFKDDIRNIRVFKKITQSAIDRLDDRIIILYGEKIKNLQNIHKDYLESPWIDFSLYKAYLNIGDYEKSLEVLNNLFDIRGNVKKLSISKIKYMQSDIYRKMRKYKQEKIYLKDCSDIKNEKVWPDLCKEALKWLE